MRIKKLVSGILLAAILVTGSVFILNRNNQAKKQVEKGTSVIKVGSKDFTENLIVAELYALALEDEGYKVERLSNISGSLIHQSLISNEIDLYPEYTGTGLLSILGQPLETDPQKVYQTVKDAYKEKFQVTWLDYSKANDGQGLVIRTDIAEKLGITSISELVYQTVKDAYKEKFQVTWLDYSKANDGQGLVIRTDIAEKLGITSISELQKHAAELRFASQGEFDQRDDGIPGLTKTYGVFNWKSSKVYDNSLKYSVLENDEADVTPAYTTEGQLVNKAKFTLLEDDKQFWPPYNLAPVVRDQVLKDNPKLAEVLNKVSASLDTETITKLNARVDVDGENYSSVARDFYQSIK